MGKKKVRMPADIKRDARLWKWLDKHLTLEHANIRSIYDYVTRYYK